jgi:hypothetical protein
MGSRTATPTEPNALLILTGKLKVLKYMGT